MTRFLSIIHDLQYSSIVELTRFIVDEDIYCDKQSRPSHFSLWAGRGEDFYMMYMEECGQTLAPGLEGCIHDTRPVTTD